MLIVLVGLAAMYLGTGLTSDVLGGFFLGLAAGAAVHVLFGAPSGRPSAAQIQTALGDLGLTVTGLAPSDEQYPGATIMDGSLDVGRPDARVRVRRATSATGSSRRSSGTDVMYKDPGLPVFGSRLQTVEHLAYASMVADQAGVSTPRVLQDRVRRPGRRVARHRRPDRPSRSPSSATTSPTRTLAAAWTALDQLHGAGITHGRIAPDRLLVQSDGE